MKKLLKSLAFVFLAALFFVVACNPLATGNQSRDADYSGSGNTSPNRYWVTFHVEGGSGAPSSQLITEGKTVEKPGTDPKPADPHKPFIHWATKSDGITAYNFNTPVRGPLDLYAVYGIKVTVKAGPEDIIVPGQKLSELSNAPKKPNALFKYWSTTADGPRYDLTMPVTAPLTLYPVYLNIPPDQTRIYAIQGTSHTSSYVSTSVNTVPGIVTAIRYSNGKPSGFYVQDQDGDANVVTSDGIYVHSGDNHFPDGLKIGDAVTVTGTVVEHAYDTKQLKTTQIKITTKTDVAVLSSKNPLPEAVEITVDKLEKPVFTVNLDALDPASEAIDYYESLEGMRVKMSNPKVVAAPYKDTQYVASPTANGLTPRGGLMYNSYNSTGRVCVYPYACFAEKSEANIAEPEPTIGDSYNGDIIGVLGYSFSNYQIEITEKLPTLTRGNIIPETSQITFDADKLNIVSYNLENFSKAIPPKAKDRHPSGKSPEERATAFADHFVNQLKAPDVICLIEIQDDTSGKNDSIVSAEQTLQLLIDKINAISAYTYKPVNIDPENNKDGGAPGSNIRCCYLYRDDRIELVLDSDNNLANSSHATSAVVVPGGLKLMQNPARIGIGASSFNDCRKSLVAHFKFKGSINGGKDFFVINNHLTSKRGDGQIWGAVQPVVRSSEVARHQQAEVLKTFINSVKAARPDARIISVGDYNDFWFSETLKEVKNAGMKNAIENLPLNERYTYVYSGHSQTLDNILVTDNISVDYTDVLHLNSELSPKVRLSDHDPVFVKLNLQ